MRGNSCRSRLFYSCASVVLLLASSAWVHAQTATSAEPAQVQALADAVRDLQTQVQSLNSQLAELRSEGAADRADARQMRRELDLAREEGRARTQDKASPLARLASLTSVSTGHAAGTPVPAPQSNGVPQESGGGDSLAKIEEEQQMNEAKIGEQYQTKVESASRYRVRLSGIVLLNMFDNHGTVDNQDFPQIALAKGLLDSPSAFGASLRQSQIGLEAFGPDVAGAHTSASVKFDFAGGFPDVPNGATMGIVRLRTATFRLDWHDTSLVGGQDALFFAPLAPRSLASLALPALSYAGNLWSWVPQVRIEHRMTISENSSVQFQAGILDSLSGDLPGEGPSQYPSWGEASGLPAFATRVAWSHGFFGQMATIGAGGYFGRQDWGFARKVDGWAATADLMLPLGRLFEFGGQFYRGRALGGLGGGIGQSVLFTGPLTDPSASVLGLDSMGGWVQLKFKPRSKLEFNGAVGQDNPFAHELRRYNANQSYFGPLLSKNLSPFVNVIYQVRSDILFSFEYRYLRTFPLDGTAVSANHINIGLGYLF